MAHILIVEDESHIRFLIQRILEVEGHLVAEAWDGLDALSVIQLLSRPFDLILLDIRMPSVDGNAFLCELKKHPSPPPVVIVSAFWDPIEEEAFVVKRISKPFTRAQLLEAVQLGLGRVGSRLPIERVAVY